MVGMAINLFWWLMCTEGVLKHSRGLPKRVYFLMCIFLNIFCTLASGCGVPIPPKPADSSLLGMDADILIPQDTQ